MPAPTPQTHRTRLPHSAPSGFFLETLVKSFSLLTSKKVTIPNHFSVFSKKFNCYLNAYSKVVLTVSMVKHKSDHKPFITVQTDLLPSQRPSGDETHQASRQKDL